MEVRRSSFIVVGSSIKVPTKFASRVTILSSFPSISLLLFLDSSFSRRERENRSGSTTINQCDSLFSSPLLLHLSIFVELPFFVLPQLFRHRSFYPSPPFFSFHLYASAIIIGELTAQIFNLVWQMADLEARGTFARRDKRRRDPSIYVRSYEPRKFSDGEDHIVCPHGAPLVFFFFFFICLFFCAMPFPVFLRMRSTSYPSFTLLPLSTFWQESTRRREIYKR